MSIRAKFRLLRYTTHMTMRTKPGLPPGTPYSADTQESVEVRTLHFMAVCDGSAENKAFFASTPGGIMELPIVSPEAWKEFGLNCEYYLDFTPVGPSPA